MSVSRSALPVVELFRTATNRKVIDFMVDQDPEQPLRRKEIMDATNLSRESLSRAIGTDESWGPLYLFGIVDVPNPEGSMPRVHRCESEVMEFLEANKSYDFGQWFDLSARQNLTEFFLQRADSETDYSRYNIVEESGSSYPGIDNNLEAYIEANIITRHDAEDGSRADEYYRLNDDSEVLNALYVLNDLLYETYEKRTDS
jgi:DNA-binding transcriptional ArsR family regulator